MKRIFLLSCFAFLSAFGIAQELDLEAVVSNPSNEINDGVIEIKVSGGQAPYTYKWSNEETSLKSAKAEGLTEGIDYTVIVTDSQGESVTITV